MGQSDKWHTPKQIKIERAGEPRGTRRGSLKKGERKKGVKARVDELKSSRRTLQTYAGWIIEDRKRPQHANSYQWGWDRHFDEQQKKHVVLIAAALKDKVIESDEEWVVERP